MDINTSTYAATSSTSTSIEKNSKTQSKSSTSKPDTTTTTSTSSAQTDSYVSSSKTAVKGLYSKPNKLTDEQIQALKDAQAESKMQLVKTLTASLTTGQSGNASIADSTASSNIFKSAFSSYSVELPELATDLEGAKAAISEGGAYSVDAVATRIMDLATSLAGDDPAMLEKMRAAVKKGFGSAGDTFSQITGESKLPQICQDTYTEVMKRFDDLEKKSTTSTYESNSPETN